MSNEEANAIERVFFLTWWAANSERLLSKLRDCGIHELSDEAKIRDVFEACYKAGVVGGIVEGWEAARRENSRCDGQFDPTFTDLDEHFSFEASRTHADIFGPYFASKKRPLIRK